MNPLVVTALVIAAMFALVPLAAWAARGRWQDAWAAAKGYGLCMFLLVVGPALIGWLFTTIALFIS